MNLTHIMINKSKKIQSEISAGELLDKISILEIKLDKIKDKNSHAEVNKEYEMLNNVKKLNIEITEKIKHLLKRSTYGMVVKIKILSSLCAFLISLITPLT